MGGIGQGDFRGQREPASDVWEFSVTRPLQTVTTPPVRVGEHHLGIDGLGTTRVVVFGARRGHLT